MTYMTHFIEKEKDNDSRISCGHTLRHTINKNETDTCASKFKIRPYFLIRKY